MIFNLYEKGPAWFSSSFANCLVDFVGRSIGAARTNDRMSYATCVRTFDRLPELKHRSA